jgi:hypothetical protein
VAKLKIVSSTGGYRGAQGSVTWKRSAGKSLLITLHLA